MATAILAYDTLYIKTHVELMNEVQEINENIYRSTSYAYWVKGTCSTYMILGALVCCIYSIHFSWQSL